MSSSRTEPTLKFCALAAPAELGFSFEGLAVSSDILVGQGGSAWRHSAVTVPGAQGLLLLQGDPTSSTVPYNTIVHSSSTMARNLQDLGLTPPGV